MAARVCQCRICFQVPGLRYPWPDDNTVKSAPIFTAFTTGSYPHLPTLTITCIYFGCKGQIWTNNLWRHCVLVSIIQLERPKTATKATQVITQTTTSIWPSQTHSGSQIAPELPFLRPLHHWRCILFWNLARQLLWNASLSNNRHNQFNSRCDHLAMASKNMLWQPWDMWSEEMMIKCSNPEVCSPCFTPKCGIYSMAAPAVFLLLLRSGCLEIRAWRQRKVMHPNCSSLQESLGWPTGFATDHLNSFKNKLYLWRNTSCNSQNVLLKALLDRVVLLWHCHTLICTMKTIFE